MNKKILVIMAVVLSLLTSSFAAIVYEDQYYQRNLANALSGGSTDPIKSFINEAEGYLEGATGFPSLYFTPTDTAPTAAEGVIYASDADNALKYYNGTAWVDIDVSGSSSLATAYTAGSKILAPTLAVEIEVADGSNNAALLLDYDDATTNAMDVLQITNAGDDAAAVSIQIDGQAAGYDIQGTGDVWNVTTTGIATLVGLVVTTEDLELENGAEIQNVVDTEIRFIEDNGSADEDFIIDFGTNSVALKSGTGVVAIDFASLDALSGINTIAFDGAVANTITQTGTGATDDLTISQAASAQDASLILQSSGTGTDALSLISSVADISLSSADNVTRTAADNITDTTTDGGYTLTIGGSANGDYTATVADNFSTVVVGSLTLQNTEAASDITINSVLGSIAIEAEEDAASAVLITADGGTSSTMKLHNDTGTDAASIELASDVGGITATANAAGKDIGIYSVLGSIIMEAEEDAADAVLITADGSTASTIKIHNDTGTSVTEGAASIGLLSDAGGVELRSTANLGNAVALTSDGGATGTILVFNDQGTSTTEGAASNQLLSDVGSGELKSGLNGADAINIMVDSDTAGGITIFNDTGTGDESILLSTDVGGVTVNAAAGSVDIEAVGAEAGDIILNSGDDMTFTVAGDLTLGVTGTFSAGGTAVTNQLASVEEITAETDTLGAAESGKIIVGDYTGTQTITLPTAAAGLIFTFVDSSATAGDDLVIDSNTGDTIDGDTAGDAIESVTDALGQSITLVAIDATQWITLHRSGTWGQQ